MDQVVDPSDPKPLQSSSNDVRSRVRMLCESENARTILLALGIVAFFALTSYYGEHHGERQTSVSACDSHLCSDPVADAAPATSTPQATPDIGRMQTDQGSRQPEPDADRHRNQPALSGKVSIAGVVASRKTNARARVGVAYAVQFQAYIDDLENNHGARILFMGGIRRGRCSPSGMHPCGKALDVCQLRRGVVDPRCHLPPRRMLAQIASSHGLFEGGRWCNSDYGHVQLGLTARDCGDRRTRIVRQQIAPQAGREAAIVSFE